MSVGFFGKLPARGDFVRSGLPRSFTDPWDAWLQRGLAYTQAAAPGWVAAWLEAPVWRFRLAPGLCGQDAVLGLWLPSVDRAGRYFPLTIAIVGPASLPPAFLDQAEQAGLDALAQDLEPAALSTRLQSAASVGGTSDAPSTAHGALWWTQGGPRVAAATIETASLPEGATFAAMVDATWNLAETAA